MVDKRVCYNRETWRRKVYERKMPFWTDTIKTPGELVGD
jgi:hypothetical protein